MATKKIKTAVVINVKDQTITQEPGAWDFQDLYSTIECSLVERVQLGQGADLWLDEEGLYNQNKGFRITNRRTGQSQVFMGTGVILFSAGFRIPIVDLMASLKRDISWVDRDVDVIPEFETSFMSF